MKVLVFCAHADDEVIAIGGTLRKLADTGAEIRLVIFSEGAEGYTTLEERERIVATRDRETRQVCDILGIREYRNLHLLDWDLHVNNATYHAVVGQIRQFQPDLIFTHSRADYNDHQAIHDVVVEGWFHAAQACAMTEGPVWPMAPLYEFEVLQALAAPTLIVDITDTYAAKVQAMECYGSQHAMVGGVFQLMEGRALERGYMIGVRYGEALQQTTYRPLPIQDVRRLAGAPGESRAC